MTKPFSNITDEMMNHLMPGQRPLQDAMRELDGGTDEDDDGVFDTLVVDGTLAVAGATTVTAPSGSPLVVTCPGSGAGVTAIKGTAGGLAVTGDVCGVQGICNGTSNATAAARGAVGFYAEASNTRSAGANDVTNYGIYAYAGGGQVNYAGFFDGKLATSGELEVDGTATLAAGLSVTNAAAALTNPVTVTKTGTGLLSTNLTAVNASGDPTLDATAVGRGFTALSGSANASRSAGANVVSNIGVYGDATGGQENYGVYGYAAAAAGNYAVYSDGDAKVTGDFEVDGALNHDGTTAGFMGAAPVVRQPIGAVAAATTIGAALILLGLCSADEP